MDIQCGNRLGHHEELVAKSTKELQQSFTRSMHLSEQLEVDSFFFIL